MELAVAPGDLPVAVSTHCGASIQSTDPPVEAVAPGTRMPEAMANTPIRMTKAANLQSLVLGPVSMEGSCRWLLFRLGPSLVVTELLAGDGEDLFGQLGAFGGAQGGGCYAEDDVLGVDLLDGDPGRVAGGDGDALT